jgi:5-methyltetrahydrofolate--homocysteine methyltransferase
MALDLNNFRGRITITDGACGTELAKRGLPAGAIPELWNLDNPAAVGDVARAYVAAGSEVVLTNSFNANPFALAGHELAGRLEEIAEKAAAIARAAVNSAAHVFGSIGSTGKVLMMGDVDEQQVYNGFAAAARALERGGAEAIVLETMTELAEVLLALRAVRENTALPVIASLTFGSGPDGTATVMGVTPEQVVREAAPAGAAVFGANCGVGPEPYIRVVQRYRAATDALIWVKPNAGLPQLKNGRNVFPMDAEAFAAAVPALVAAGANFVGGCCGTTPEHIAAVRRLVSSMKA